MILSFINRKFCQIDPQAQAFNHFYRELLLSSHYQNLSNEIQAHPGVAYNLATAELYRELEAWAQKHNGPFADIGCGLGVLCALLPHNKKVFGWDFSSEAIHGAKKRYPHQEFNLYHFNLGYPKQQKSIPYKVSLDSLYNNDRRYNSAIALKKNLKTLLRQKTKSFFLIQNFKEEVELHVSGYHIETSDHTESFSRTVEAWIKALQSDQVKEDKKKYPLLWSTIEREFLKHQRSLDEKSFRRLRFIFNKI